MSKQKSKIAIDIDDVIADSTEALRISVNNHLGINLTKEDYKVKHPAYWGYYGAVWASHGIEDKLSFDALHEDMEVDQSHIELVAGAEYAINQLSKKYDVVFMTSRFGAWQEATNKWVKDRFSSHHEIYFANNHREPAKKSKGELCRDMNAVLLIDDSVDHCRSAAEHNVRAILFGDYGWQNEVPEGVVRCKDWPAILEYCDGL